MKGISVELLDYCGSDEAVANAARVSFSAFGEWNGIPEGYTKERCDKLVKYLASHKHTTPFRQNCITIRCKAPIFLARQLMKHQSGLTWSEASRRYVDTPPEFFIPEYWRSRPEGSLKQGSGNKVITHLNESKDSDWTVDLDYAHHLEWCLNLYEEMLSSGVAPEMARMVLPQSMIVDWVWSGNLLAYAHCYNLRIKENAQIEANEFAKELGKVLEPLFPVSWKALTGVEK